MPFQQRSLHPLCCLDLFWLMSKIFTVGSWKRSYRAYKIMFVYIKKGKGKGKEGHCVEHPLPSLTSSHEDPAGQEEEAGRGEATCPRSPRSLQWESPTDWLIPALPCSTRGHSPGGAGKQKLTVRAQKRVGSRKGKSPRDLVGRQLPLSSHTCRPRPFTCRTTLSSN